MMQDVERTDDTANRNIYDKQRTRAAIHWPISTHDAYLPYVLPDSQGSFAAFGTRDPYGLAANTGKVLL